VNEEAMAHWGLLSQIKKKYIFFSLLLVLGMYKYRYIRPAILLVNALHRIKKNK